MPTKIVVKTKVSGIRSDGGANGGSVCWLMQAVVVAAAAGVTAKLKKTYSITWLCDLPSSLSFFR